MAAAGTIAYRGKGNIYVNVTNRCSCDCDFCFRSFTSEVFGADLTLDAEPEAEQVEHEIERAFLDGPADEVAFCGLGEPTMRLDTVLEVTGWLQARRVASRLVTNGHGQLLNPGAEVVPALARAGLGAATVSLNAADPETYDLLCRPIFSKAHRAVIGFAQDCVASGIETTLTAVDLPEADVEGCREVAAAMGAGFRVRPCVPHPDAAPRARGYACDDPPNAICDTKEG